MRIWRIACYDDAFMHYFRATKREAEQVAAEFIRDSKDTHPTATAEVEPVDVTPTRRGIARALQDEIDLTCFNEH